MFAGLLAEIRAYGEGLVIAEQIPARLVPDVIKNTAVKITHRLPAADDRDAVGATMNATPAQSRYLVTLAPGEAAVFCRRDGLPDLGESQRWYGTGGGVSPAAHTMPGRWCTSDRPPVARNAPAARARCATCVPPSARLTNCPGSACGRNSPCSRT